MNKKGSTTETVFSMRATFFELEGQLQLCRQQGHIEESYASEKVNLELSFKSSAPHSSLLDISELFRGYVRSGDKLRRKNSLNNPHS